jgi:hypothetical protein
LIRMRLTSSLPVALFFRNTTVAVLHMSSSLPEVPESPRELLSSTPPSPPALHPMDLLYN